MNVLINRKLLYAAVRYPKYYAAAENVANMYSKAQPSDTVLFGETIMKAHKDMPIAIVSNPITAVLCRLLYVQPYLGAAVPIWVSTCTSRLTSEHIATLLGRDCYFYPTAQQCEQWNSTVCNYRKYLGDVSLVDNSLLLLHELCPKKIPNTIDLAYVVAQSYNIAKLYYEGDLIRFAKALELI